MRAFPHERFSSEITLSPEMIGEYAHLVGDTNPCTTIRHLPPQRASGG